MSDPREQQEREELDLDPETVRDLELDDAGGENVVGGGTNENRPTASRNAAC
jgi:hypothetical protein